MRVEKNPVEMQCCGQRGCDSPHPNSLYTGTGQAGCATGLFNSGTTIQKRLCWSKWDSLAVPGVVEGGQHSSIQPQIPGLRVASPPRCCLGFPISMGIRQHSGGTSLLEAVNGLPSGCNDQ